MELDEIKNILDEELGLLLESLVKRLVTSFKQLNKYLPKAWYDMTTNIEPFGSMWGRGIVGSDGTVIITTAGTKHAVIKQRLEADTDMTFYWGYVGSNETLYLELASIRGSGFNRKNVPIIASAVMDRVKQLKWNVSPNNIIFETWNYDRN